MISVLAILFFKEAHTSLRCACETFGHTRHTNAANVSITPQPHIRTFLKCAYAAQSS